MTEVEFHTGVEDKLDFACRLLRKAYRSGARVLVTGPSVVIGALDRALWTFEERDFIPHVRVPSAPAALAARTPVWLADGGVPPDAPEVLINLGADAPADLAPFSRVIEVLSTEPDDAQAGRQRWRDYKARGFEIRHHGAGRS